MTEAETDVTSIYEDTQVVAREAETEATAWFNEGGEKYPTLLLIITATANVLCRNQS